MTPAEFMASLRDCVADDLPLYIQFLRSETGSLDTPEQLADWAERIRTNPRAWLDGNQLVEPEKRDRVASLIRALDRSEALNRHMRIATAFAKDDSRFEEACVDLVTNQDRFDEAAQQYVIERLIENDELISGALHVMLNDADIREALGIPEGTTPEAFMIELKRAIQDSGSVKEALARVPGGELLALTCTPVAVCAVSVLVLAHAYVAAYTIAAVAVVAVTKVAVPSSVSVSGTGLATGPLVRATPTASSIIVESQVDHPLWVVLSTNHGLKRFGLPARSRSDKLALSGIKALLVGGSGNPVRGYRDADARGSSLGAIKLLATQPTTITVLPTEQHGEITATSREGQSAIEYVCYEQSEGEFVYHVSTIAAVAPIGFDYRATTDQSLAAERFYGSLRAKRLLDKFSKGKPV